MTEIRIRGELGNEESGGHGPNNEDCRQKSPIVIRAAKVVMKTEKYNSILSLNIAHDEQWNRK